MSHWRDDPYVWEKPLTLPHVPKHDFLDPVRFELAVDHALYCADADLDPDLDGVYFSSLQSSLSLSEDCSLRLSY